MAVDDAGGWRQQRGGAAQRRFQPHGLFAGNVLQVVHAVGARAGDVLQLGRLGRVGGHDQLAQALVRHAALGAIGVEQMLAAHAQPGFQAAGRVIDAGVYDFGVARAGAGADGLGGFCHQHLASAQRQGPRDRQADHARADHDAVDVGAHRRAPAADNACARERRVVMAFSWRRGRRRGEVEAAGMEDQRRLAAVAAALDFADHDDVIAFDVAAAVVAFEPGGAAAVQHRRAARRPRHGQAVEAVGRSAGGEAARQRDLVGAQHIDDVAIAALEGFPRRRAAGQAPQHQRRIQRHRVEGADRQPDGRAIGVGGGDHRHAGGVASQCGAEEGGVEVRLGNSHVSSRRRHPYRGSADPAPPVRSCALGKRAALGASMAIGVRSSSRRRRGRSAGGRRRDGRPCQNSNAVGFRR